MWGSETAETNLRMLLFPCYLQLLGVDVGERDCGDEFADDAVTMLFAAVGGIDVRERDCGDESADAAVCMLFAAVGGRCGGARLRRRICGRCFYHAICSCWGGGDGAADGGGGGCCCVNMRSLRGPDFGPLILEELGSETAETNLWTLLLPCYLQLLGVDVGERDCGDESAKAAVTMLFASICSCWG